MGGLATVAYFASVLALVVRIAWLDQWNLACWVTLGLFAATAGADRLEEPSKKSLAWGVAFFAILCGAVTYLPDLWFKIAYLLNHAQNYWWNANETMRSVPFNDGRFIWGHRLEPLSRAFRWVYITGFDMVVWIPVVRSLLAYDARKTIRYALSAHIIQFPLIIPFYSAFRVDEVWSVLGDPDRCARGWSDETRLNLGANCFPSMHTSVAFAILILALREKSPVYRVMMVVYASSIIFSTVYMEIHWLIDVAGGLLLGLGSVKLTDWLLQKFEARYAPAR